MSKQKFEAASLDTIDDGRVKAAIDLHLRQLAADIADRGSDGAKRSLTIKLELEPQVSSGEVYNVATEITVTANVPPRRTRPLSMTVEADSRNRAVLMFNEASPDNVHQGTLDETSPDKK